jgi:CRISPR-associated protein Cmr3
MDIRIEPLDTLFFRDGKPFSMGEETWADGYRLPPPSVLYGALRTAIATQNGIPFAEVLEKLSKNKFSIKGLHYKLAENNILPLPLDLVEHPKDIHIQEAEEEEKRYEVKPLVVRPVPDGLVTKSQKKSKYLPIAQNWEQVEDLEEGFILVTELEKYLEGDLKTTLALKLRDFVPNEPKVGNGRNDLTRSVEDSLLYRTDMKRSDILQIGVSFHLEGFQEGRSLVRLGGEGKLAQISAVRLPFKAIQKAIDFRGNRFKIYFATPAILREGVSDLTNLGIQATLVAACVGKPVYIGGFDMVKKEPKAMYKAVPAGSVFYYESPDDISKLNDHQGISLSDERKEEGFGIAYFGTWDISEK